VALCTDDKPNIGDPDPGNTATGGTRNFPDRARQLPAQGRQIPCSACGNFAAFGRKWDQSSVACRFEKASIWANRNVNDEPDGILARDVGHRLQESIRGCRDMGYQAVVL